jgi:DNA repair exonuclease SbcCD ATPase subunit
MAKKNNKKATKKNEVAKKDIDMKKPDTKAVEEGESQETDREESTVDETAIEDPIISEDVSNIEPDTEQNNEVGIDHEQDIPAVVVSESNPTDTVVDSEEARQASIATTDTPPKTKKRLTLLERLALAAKGKKQRSSTPTPTSSAAGTPPATGSDEPKNVIIKEENDPLAENKVTIKDEEKVGKTGLESELASDGKYRDELKQLAAEIENLKANNSELSEENKQLKSQSSKPGNINKETIQLKEQLASKDETIEQLMKEGQVLSVKELKLNESIKKLKASNNDLEQSLNDYSKKNEQVLLKLNEQEDFLKKHKFKSINQLIDDYNDISKKLSQSNDDLEKEKQLDWEGKYKEQQRLYETESSERKQSIKKLNELKIQFDMSKKQNSLELESKNTTINDLKRSISSIRDENSKEIYRLENKIESLRVENERSPGSLSGNKDYNNCERNDTDTILNPKQIDYEEFVKLSNNHHSLQQQYLSSQENWKLIESNLLNKIDVLTSSVDSLKKSKSKSMNEIQKLQNSLQRKMEEYDQLIEKFDELTNEKEEIVFQNQVKDTDYQELQEKFDKFQQIYNTDRQNLNSKIKQLTESLEKSKNNSNTSLGPFEQTSPNRQNLNGLHLNLEPPKLMKHHSSNSINDASYNNSGWPDIKFGESSTTPAVSREYSAVFMNRSHNNSLASLMDNVDTATELANDNYSFNSKYPSHMGNGSISGIIPTSGNNNIQLINKMSSNIRRLEIELSTMKDENTQLSLDKEQAQQEILKQFKLMEEVNSLKKQITTLQTEIDQKSRQEETMLELIGEKSEQVEELRADVQDLKDLCKLQVQQMIEIQESK